MLELSIIQSISIICLSVLTSIFIIGYFICKADNKSKEYNTKDRVVTKKREQNIPDIIKFPPMPKTKRPKLPSGLNTKAMNTLKRSLKNYKYMDNIDIKRDSDFANSLQDTINEFKQKCNHRLKISTDSYTDEIKKYVEQKIYSSNKKRISNLRTGQSGWVVPWSVGKYGENIYVNANLGVMEEKSRTYNVKIIRTSSLNIIFDISECDIVTTQAIITDYCHRPLVCDDDDMIRVEIIS